MCTEIFISYTYVHYHLYFYIKVAHARSRLQNMKTLKKKEWRKCGDPDMFLLHHPKETWELRDNLPPYFIDSCEEMYYKTLKQPVNLHLDVSQQEGRPSTVGNVAEFSGGSSVVTSKKTLVRAKGICRLCKSEQSRNKLFDIYGARKMRGRDRLSYKMKMKTLFDVDIQQVQGNADASKICENCANFTDKVWKFREGCIQKEHASQLTCTEKQQQQRQQQQ